MKYKMKPGREVFEVVDGEHAGTTYHPNREYDRQEIPERELHRFEVVKAKKTKAPVAEKQGQDETGKTGKKVKDATN